MGFFTEEIAIDLGTANTLIIHNDKVVINSPSIVAMDRSTKKIIAIADKISVNVILFCLILFIKIIRLIQ